MSFFPTKPVLFLFTILVFSLKLFAHGEDKPGPHGGNIQMPGPFHTEVFKSSEDSFKVYLLDLNWKSPLVNNSKVSVSIQQEKQIVAAKCETKEDFFVCHFPKNQNTSKGKLIVRAERNGQKGMPAEYNLPLQFSGSEAGKVDPHAGHH